MISSPAWKSTPSSRKSPHSMPVFTDCTSSLWCFMAVREPARDTQCQISAVFFFFFLTFREQRTFDSSSQYHLGKWLWKSFCKPIPMLETETAESDIVFGLFDLSSFKTMSMLTCSVHSSSPSQSISRPRLSLNLSFLSSCPFWTLQPATGTFFFPTVTENVASTVASPERQRDETNKGLVVHKPRQKRNRCREVFENLVYWYWKEWIFLECWLCNCVWCSQFHWL